MFADELGVWLIISEALLVAALLMGVHGWLVVFRFIKLVADIFLGITLRAGPFSFTMGDRGRKN